MHVEVDQSKISNNSKNNKTSEVSKMKNENDKLLKRTLKFSQDLIDLINRLPKNLVNLDISEQVLQSGTSIGANYREACEAVSSKDFVHKIKTIIKEARETKYWLKLLLKNNLELPEDIIKLGKENAELIKIFASIAWKFKKK